MSAIIDFAAVQAYLRQRLPYFEPLSFSVCLSFCLSVSVSVSPPLSTSLIFSQASFFVAGYVSGAFHKQFSSFSWVYCDFFLWYLIWNIYKTMTNLSHLSVGCWIKNIQICQTRVTMTMTSKWALSRENLSSGFLKKRVSNHQLQRLARKLKIRS